LTPEPLTPHCLPVCFGTSELSPWGNAGSCWLTAGGLICEVTIVVFGEDEAPPLLGAYTLEGLALAVDPTSQRLVPTHMILY